MTTSHVGDKKQECILCGTCLEVCPMVRATGREELSPKAKQYLARALAESPGALAGKKVKDLAALCVSCGRCEKVCPQELCGPDLVAELRAAHPDLHQWLWKTWIEKAGALWPAMATLARVAPKSLPGNVGELLLKKVRSMRPAATVEPWLRPERWDGALQGQKVAIFPGCMAVHLRREWTGKAETVLRAMGAEPVRANFTCCGCTLGHAGAVDAQAAMQRANQQAWREAGRPRILIFCATCRCGLKSYAKSAFLGWEPDEAEAWRSSILSLSQALGESSFVDTPGKAPGRVFYHTPCHGSGSGEERKWLQAHLGGRFAGHTDGQCCGLGGVLQLADPELSATVAQSVWDKLRPEPGDVVFTGCSGCVLQLTTTAPEGVRVGHWLQALAV